jgi:hypothetical protein
MSTTLIIIGVLAAIGIALFIGKQNTDKLLQEGKIINRKSGFWEEKQFFELNAPYEAVLAAARNVDYTGTAADITYNFDGKKIIFFRSGKSWNAALQYLGMSEGKYLYSLSFTGWQTRRGVPYDVNSMNILLTQTEKMLLSLDPETMVEVHMMELNTKTRFI